MVAAKLPYKTLGGIVPCPGGWLIVPARLAGVTVNAEQPEVVPILYMTVIGMNLALGCDVRLAARRARFDTRFLQLGLHPGGGHTWMMRRITGPQTTAAAVLFGEVLDGAEAERLGLVLRCVDDEALLATAHTMAARAAAAPR